MNYAALLPVAATTSRRIECPLSLNRVQLKMSWKQAGKNVLNKVFYLFLEVNQKLNELYCITKMRKSLSESEGEKMEERMN